VCSAGKSFVHGYIQCMNTSFRLVVFALASTVVLSLAGCAVYPVNQPVAYGTAYPQVYDGGRGYYPSPYPAPYAVQPYYVEPYYVPTFPFYGFFGYRHGEERHRHEGRR
jgi:hypothetical protein